MDKKKVDSMRWDQYDIELPPLDPKLVEDMLGILDNLDSRKVDKVNWEERRLMNEATKRSGHFLHFDEGEEDTTPEEVESSQQLDEISGATSKKEKDLMAGMGDILKELEQIDE